MASANPVVSLWGGLESAAVGMGMESPVSRALGGAIAGLAIVLLVKPSVSYAATGERLAWSVTASDSDKGATTRFPWWAWPLSFGLFFGLFV